MRKQYLKFKAWMARVDMKDARRSVASDLKKASAALFGLLLVSLPGAYASVFTAMAEFIGVKVAGSAGFHLDPGCLGYWNGCASNACIPSGMRPQASCQARKARSRASSKRRR